MVTGCYERRSPTITANIKFSKWGTVLADDKLVSAIIDRIVHHGRLIELTEPNRRMDATFMPLERGRRSRWSNRGRGMAPGGSRARAGGKVPGVFGKVKMNIHICSFSD